MIAQISDQTLDRADKFKPNILLQVKSVLFSNTTTYRGFRSNRDSDQLGYSNFVIQILLPSKIQFLSVGFHPQASLSQIIKWLQNKT